MWKVVQLYATLDNAFIEFIHTVTLLDTFEKHTCLIPTGTLMCLHNGPLLLWIDNLQLMCIINGLELIWIDDLD